ncbi:MAG TPA: HEAT repeat domain-containing protein [Pyrinomonadaceae bacterium]|nr:HEAT repeat domain-containing protein [Pyrinomonadaceae bacterium]
MMKAFTFILNTRRGRAAAASALAAVVLSASAAVSSAQSFRDSLRGFAQDGNTANASPSARLLRQGRDLISEENWTKAAETLRTFLTQYPRDREADAALYWYAYALNKQGDRAGAEKMLKQLLVAHSRSNWADDAQALLAQIDPKFADTLRETQNCELKVVALQSLFENSPERAMEYVRQVLVAPETPRCRLKEAAVSLLANHGGAQATPILLEIARNQQADPKIRRTAIHRLGEEGGPAVFDELARLYDAERDQKIKEQLLHAFGDTKDPRGRAKLLQIARTPTESVSVRRRAIHSLGDRADSAYDDLIQIYNADQNLEIRRQLLHAFSDMKDPRGMQKLLEIARGTSSEGVELRRTAIHHLADKNSEAHVDELMRIFETDPSVEIKRQILHAFSDMKSARARAKVAEVARGQNFPVELRRAAIHHFLDGRDDAQSVDVVISLYDAERSVEIKRSLLHALGESKQKSALRKLMAIARNQSEPVELRRAAVNQIGESKDPEARAFLEELLKP